MKLQELFEGQEWKPEYYGKGYPYKVGMQIDDIDYGTLKVTKVGEDEIEAMIVDPKMVGDVARLPSGDVLRIPLSTYNNEGEPYDMDLEEGSTDIEVDFDPANYKSVIKTLQDREISGKQKAVFLKSRIMRRLKAGGSVSRKEVLGMMDNLV